jgi:RNA polymerase sigma-B factor
MVRNLLERLPERERAIVSMRFFDELSQSEIAERVGISQMHVSRLLRSSFERMRAWADGEPG